MDGWKTRLLSLLGRLGLFFRCEMAVSFREGKAGNPDIPALPQDTLATASPALAPAPPVQELRQVPPVASRGERLRRRPVQRDGLGGLAGPQGALAEVLVLLYPPETRKKSRKTPLKLQNNHDNIYLYIYIYSSLYICNFWLIHCHIIFASSTNQPIQWFFLTFFNRSNLHHFLSPNFHYVSAIYGPSFKN